MKTKTFSLTINKYKEQKQKKMFVCTQHSTVFINKFSTFTCSLRPRRPPPGF